MGWAYSGGLDCFRLLVSLWNPLIVVSSGRRTPPFMVVSRNASLYFPLPWLLSPFNYSLIHSFISSVSMYQNTASCPGCTYIIQSWPLGKTLLFPFSCTPKLESTVCFPEVDISKHITQKMEDVLDIYDLLRFKENNINSRAHVRTFKNIYIWAFYTKASESFHFREGAEAEVWWALSTPPLLEHPHMGLSLSLSDRRGAVKVGGNLGEEESWLHDLGWLGSFFSTHLHSRRGGRGQDLSSTSEDHCLPQDSVLYRTVSILQK